jgi:hypothetical protein
LWGGARTPYPLNMRLDRVHRKYRCYREKTHLHPSWALNPDFSASPYTDRKIADSWNLVYFRPSIGSRDGSVGIATGYDLDDRGVRIRVPVRVRIFTSCHADRLWGPPIFLSNVYRGLFPGEQSGRGVKLTTHFQLVPRTRKCGSIHPIPHTPSWLSA